MSKFFTALVLVACSLPLIGQQGVTYQKIAKKIIKKRVVKPGLVQEDYFVTLTNLEMPSPSGNSYRSFLFRQKELAKNKLNSREKSQLKSASNSEQEISLGQNFDLVRYAGNGNMYNLYGGIPNDNTIAVSNGGIVLASINSFVYAYDLNNDTTIFANQRISLATMVNGVTGGHYFDPKIIYDPTSDSFILVLLKNSDPATNEIIVCFSTTNNPNDAWNVYYLPGNPLNNNRWTDFPAIAITKDKLYFTGNLIVPDEPWQTGFDGSIIWEISTEEGYSGVTSLNTELYSEIKHNGNFIRNLHAVQGVEGIADKMYFLSNRNFDVTNDSIFVLDIEETPDSNYLNVNVYQSNISYGVPPNGRQQDTDTSDITSGLQTNDARVLGAIKFENEIQFVGNTMNPETGFCGVYHGVISNLSSIPLIEATIIGDSIKDFGYPNIAFSGNEVCDKEVIIAFNYSSFNDFPGMAAIYCDNDKNYSKMKILKEGENFVDRLSGTYERWGDYYGLQRMYNKPGHVLAFGYVVKSNKRNTGYVIELISPDTNSLKVNYVVDASLGLCQQEIELLISGGVEPYNIIWSTGEEDFLSKNNVCVGDTILANVIDARGCSKNIEIILPYTDNKGELLVYPNPSPNWVAVQFDLEKESHLKVFLYDEKGALVTVLLDRTGKVGTNELVFSTESLASGNYMITLLVDGEVYKSSTLIKN